MLENPVNTGVVHFIELEKWGYFCSVGNTLVTLDGD